MAHVPALAGAAGEIGFASPCVFFLEGGGRQSQGEKKEDKRNKGKKKKNEGEERERNRQKKCNIDGMTHVLTACTD